MLTHRKATKTDWKRWRGKLATVAIGMLCTLWMLPLVFPLFVKNGSITSFNTEGNGTLSSASNQQIVVTGPTALQTWDIQNGTLIASKKLPYNEERVLTSDGRFLIGQNIEADSGRGPADTVWRVADGAPLSVFKPAPNYNLGGRKAFGDPSRVISTDGRMVAGSGVLSPAPEKSRRWTKAREAHFSFGDSVIYGWDTSGSKMLWSREVEALTTGTKEVGLNRSGIAAMPSLALSPDGRYLAEGLDAPGQKGIVALQLREARTGRPVRLFTTRLTSPPQKPFNDGRLNWSSLAFSQNGSFLASVGFSNNGPHYGGHDGVIYGWDVGSGQLRWTTHEATITACRAVISPDSKYVATTRTGSNRNGTIDLWDAANGDLVRTLARNTWADDAAWKRRLSLYGIWHAFFPGWRQPRRPWQIADAIAFSPDSKVIAALNYDGEVTVWPVS